MAYLFQAAGETEKVLVIDSCSQFCYMLQLPLLYALSAGCRAGFKESELSPNGRLGLVDTGSAIDPLPSQ